VLQKYIVMRVMLLMMNTFSHAERMAARPWPAEGAEIYICDILGIQAARKLAHTFSCGA
jgi:hypothetical protein